jgi:citrate synthase
MRVCAKDSAMDDKTKVEIRRGLKDVYFERSETTFIDGKAGELRYRGYSIHDLASHSTFEETAYLLTYGELPTEKQLLAFTATLIEARTLPDEVIQVIHAVQDAHPMDVLRTAVSALSASDPDAKDNSVEATIRKGVRLMSQVPLIVGTHECIRSHRNLPQPRLDLNHAAHLLLLLTGREPSENAVHLMDKDLILHAEHGSNASSFAARVVIGTEANLHAAMTAAIAALSGPAHGGAAEDVMRMATEIGEPENAAAYVKAKRDKGEAVTGFGHRVYRTEDPRARHMREGVEKLSEEMGEPKWFAILQAVVEAMQPYARFGVNVNVDFYSGAIYYLNRIKPDLFVPLFAIGRVPGWTIQCVEQLKNNILIRPLTSYSGPQPRDYLGVKHR